MAFLSCEEMLAAARNQKITLAEAVLRSDLEESRLTEAHSRAAMRHLWQVMQATSQEYDPAQRSRSGLSGGDAAKVEQAWQQGRLLGDDYLAAVTAEALKTAECNACMKRIVAAAGCCRRCCCRWRAQDRQARTPSATHCMWRQASDRSSPPAPHWRAQRAAVRPR